MSNREINTTLPVSVPTTRIELRPIDADLVQQKPLMTFKLVIPETRLPRPHYKIILDVRSDASLCLGGVAYYALSVKSPDSILDTLPVFIHQWEKM